MKIPFKYSYWVIKRKLMAGMYPGGFGDEMTLERLKTLSDLGIRSLINLTYEEEEVKYFKMIYRDLCKRYKNICCQEFIYSRYGIKNMGMPSTEQMINILDKIDQDINNDLCVYLHCIAGVGRTGIAVGCYLIRHGLIEKEDVFENIKLLRGDGKDIPITEEQNQFVLSWKKGM